MYPRGTCFLPSLPDGRLVVSSLHGLQAITPPEISLSLLSKGKLKRDLLTSPAFVKYVERDIRGRCFFMNQATRYKLNYFGLDLAFRGWSVKC